MTRSTSNRLSHVALLFVASVLSVTASRRLQVGPGAHHPTQCPSQNAQLSAWLQQEVQKVWKISSAYNALWYGKPCTAYFASDRVGGVSLRIELSGKLTPVCTRTVYHKNCQLASILFPTQRSAVGDRSEIAKDSYSHARSWCSVK